MSSTMEKYSETERDLLEHNLANKRELINERRDGLNIIIYWLRKSNLVSIELIDECGNGAVEFIVPNDRVLEARDHPYPYMYRQGLIIKQEVADDGA